MGGSTPSTQTQSTNSSSNSTSDSTTGPNSVIAPKLDSLTNAYWQFLNQNGQAPAYPTGTVAPWSADTTAANQAIVNAGMAGPQGMSQAMSQVLGTIGGNYLDPGSNPAYQAALDAGFGTQNQKFVDQVVPAINAAFGGAGRGGSGLNADSQAQAMRDLGQSQANAAAQAGAQYYTNERNNQVNALGMLPSLWNSSLNYLGAAQQAGLLQDQQAQKLADANTAAYWYDASAQPNWLLNASQILQGIYPGSTTAGNTSSNGSSYGYTTTTPSSNPMSNIMSGVLGLGNLGLQAYKTFWPSDERLKDVDGRVGFTDEGLPLYLYKYKGDDQPRIGPMAQEVARVKPDAVARHPSGFLMVDYKRAMPSGGLM